MEQLLAKVTELYNTFLFFSKSNPVVAGIFSIWGLGVFTFFLKTIPSKIINFIKRQSTTTLVLNSHDRIYYDFLNWVSENNMHSFVRNLNFNNSDRYGEGDANISIGYGLTLFFFKRYLFFMERHKVDANNTAESKEVITLTLLSRNKQIFTDLFKLIKKKSEQDQEYLKIYEWRYDSWRLLSRQFKRSLNTVIINEQNKNKLLKHIEQFEKDKDWYRTNGIPYRTGIILEGPPGTGKTSLIKALCSEKNRKLYIIDLSQMNNRTLQSAFSDLPENAIIAIEDIDTVNLKNRKLSSKEEKKDDLKTLKNMAKSLYDEEDSETMITLGGILNAIDGVASSEDRILIATSNCIKKLDSALLREGRFDLHLNIGYMTNSTLKKYLERFFPDYRDFHKWNIKKNIAPCKVQALVFENRTNIEKILKEICNQKK